MATVAPAPTLAELEAALRALDRAEEAEGDLAVLARLARMRRILEREASELLAA